MSLVRHRPHDQISQHSIRIKVRGGDIARGLRVARDIRPLPRILEVVDIVAESLQNRGVLHVIPSDAAERRVLGDEAGDDDAETLSG